MKAYKVGFSVMCPECGYVMKVDDYDSEQPGKAFMECLTSKCLLRGRWFSLDMPTIDLAEVEGYETSLDRAIRRMGTST